jgi:hypothetical protein
MLLTVAAHNVSIQNVKLSKHERHITYSVTTNVKCALLNCYTTFCNGIPFVRLTLCDVYVLKTLRFEILTLCAATFCNITSCGVYVMLLYIM